MTDTDFSHGNKPNTLSLDDLSRVSYEYRDTPYGNFIIQFYPRDHKRSVVRKALPKRFQIEYKETYEDGELVVWHLTEK